jgi:cytochrome c
VISRARFLTGLGTIAAAAAILVAVIVLSTQDEPAPRFAIAGASAGRGKAAIEAYGCGSCHTIPGVEGADATVGPPLDGFAERTYVAGVLPNLPGPLARWIMHPQQIVPGNAMPELGIGRRESRDIAQYLYGLD